MVSMHPWGIFRYILTKLGWRTDHRLLVIELPSQLKSETEMWADLPGELSWSCRLAPYNPHSLHAGRPAAARGAHWGRRRRQGRRSWQDRRRRRSDHHTAARAEDREREDTPSWSLTCHPVTDWELTFRDRETWGRNLFTALIDLTGTQCFMF